jgi:hypothetical protein
MRIVKGFLFFALMYITYSINAQENASFEVKLNKDEILFGNSLRAEFIIKNAKGKFEAPEFNDFEIVSGPNTSSFISNMNGVSNETKTYSFVLKPKKEGIFYIENAYVIAKNESDNLETAPVKVTVKSNPNGIVEEDDIVSEFSTKFGSGFGSDFFGSNFLTFPNFNFDNFAIPKRKDMPIEKEEKRIPLRPIKRL